MPPRAIPLQPRQFSLHHATISGRPAEGRAVHRSLCHHLRPAGHVASFEEAGADTGTEDILAAAARDIGHNIPGLEAAAGRRLSAPALTGSGLGGVGIEAEDVAVVFEGTAARGEQVAAEVVVVVVVEAQQQAEFVVDEPAPAPVPVPGASELLVAVAHFAEIEFVALVVGPELGVAIAVAVATSFSLHRHHPQ